MSLFKSQTRLAMAYTNEVGDKIYPVIVDIKKGIKSTEEIQFMSSDINTGVLSVAFIQGNDNYNVSGAEVVCSVMRPDASTLELPCDIVRDNVVEVPLGINGTSQDGVYSFDFKVFKGGNKVVGTPIMNYSVSLSISNDTVVSEDDRLPVLTMLMTQITTLKNETNNVISTANTAIQNANKATDNTKLAISNAQSATQKAEDVVTRVNNAIASGTQDLEVKEARDGEVSLKTRLDRDIEKAKEIYTPIEGNYISTDSSSGYLKDVEILGNTIQDVSNLADIRSVGDTVEGQELYEIPVLSCGKNLNSGFELGGIDTSSSNLGKPISDTNFIRSKFFILINGSNKITVSTDKPLSSANMVMCSYNNNMEALGYEVVYSASKAVFTPKPNTKYIRIRLQTNDLTTKVQIEEGTVATPYEPYQEDKTTILSPVQLEKVGDVADRIICKDGVWGVEKGVVDFSKIPKNWSTRTNDSGLLTFECNISKPYGDVNGNKLQIICSKLVGKDYNTLYNNPSMEGIGIKYYDNNLVVRVNISPTKLISQDISGITKYLDDAILKTIYNTPQFIPLPHDQQIKLRTFANKTNISFLTEIEGTIKAQVPKSLGATVNTHTEQINNLNKELDRVKKLEESTVSTVTTESDFTTVEATSNGYFEDVKLEGKTLVNLCTQKNINIDTQSNRKIQTCSYNFDKEYTLFFNSDKDDLNVYIQERNGELWVKNIKVGITQGLNIVKFMSSSSGVDGIRFGVNTITSIPINITNIMLLEGDHTQNPPSYFEGLKSVGESASEDGADEIVVESVKGDGNLFDFTQYISNEKVKVDYVDDNKIIIQGISGWYAGVSADFKVKPNTRYLLKTSGKSLANNSLVACSVSDVKTNTVIHVDFDATDVTKEITTISDSIRITLKCNNETNTGRVEYNNIMLVEQGNSIEYTPYQSDKKRLLYYNNETQTWEKPILRQWDSIEKHSDGKYYYHQRSGEVVLNGSEGEQWAKNGVLSTDTYVFMHLQDQQIKPTNSMEDFICDKLIPANYNNASSECISKYADGTQIVIKISTSKLSTQDEAGFKKWLQANNVTVVYQLAQEKVYECTNIDLITYANETNYVVESGTIAPKSILKVHNNISNVVKILQEKVSLLENKFIEGLKQVLAGDMYSLAELLYPEDFEEVETENNIMLLPLE